MQQLPESAERAERSENATSGIASPIDTGFADLTSHDTFSHGVPHKTFARLRDESPVYWTEWSEGKSFWSITRHADIIELNKNNQVFSSAQGIRMEDQSYEEYLARRTFQETDPPEHAQFRSKVLKSFSKRVVGKFEERMRQICADILDRTLPQAQFDATKEVARELPMRMLGAMLGLPDEDMPWLVEKGDALIANTDPEFTDFVLDKMETDAYRMMPFNSPAGAELFDYAKTLMHERRRSGQEGILELMLGAERNGEPISEEEFRNFFCLLVAAGNDTTRYSIAAGIHAMTQQPKMLEQMQDDSVWRYAADEIIRWASPALYFRRTAVEDYDLHGETIRKGDKVLLWFASANRDERAFDSPFEVDLARSPNPHLSFGQHGAHVCLGMWLAKLEVTVLFQELSKRINSIELAGDIQYLRSNFVAGIKNLPVSVELK